MNRLFIQAPDIFNFLSFSMSRPWSELNISFNRASPCSFFFFRKAAYITIEDWAAPVVRGTDIRVRYSAVSFLNVPLRPVEYVQQQPDTKTLYTKCHGFVSLRYCCLLTWMAVCTRLLPCKARRFLPEQHISTTYLSLEHVFSMVICLLMEIWRYKGVSHTS